MSQLNMAAMNGANGSIGALPLMNHGPNGVTPRPGGEPDEYDYEANLNSTIYDYFVKSGNYECARALMKSEARFYPALRSVDGEVNGTDENAMHTDSKDDMVSKRPSDLPPPNESQGPSFLLEWYSLFWDVWNAQRKKPTVNPYAMSYVQHTQAQSRLRQEQHTQLLRSGMPNIMPGDYQMMRMQNGMPMGDNLRAKAMQNRGNAYAQATPQQIAHMKQQHQLMQQQMRRDPSDMDVNGQRARTPSSGDNAPSPSKRPRIEGVPFNAQPMMQNNRGPMQSMQGQPMMDPSMNPANQMLINSGIDPETLSAGQYSTFQQQAPAVQAKSIQVNQRLQGNGRPAPRPGMPGQGSPMVGPGYDLGAGVPEFMSGQAMVRGSVPPGANNSGNHALQDYQMQLMLLEQQNKKRLLMARQEQDNVRQPEGQQIPGGPSYAQGVSPSGSRSGPSPGPNDQMGKRSPKMVPGGLPGSPMPDGMAQARSSPASMGFHGQVPAEMFQMRGIENGIGPTAPNGMRMQPSSHPGQIGGGGFNPAQPQQQHAEAMRAQATRMPNGQQWQQAPPPGQAPVMQPNQGQQPAQMGTPQQRNAMPPPQAVPTGTGANGARPSPPAQGAPPTPQPANKANPKGKKDTKETKKRPNKKNSTTSVTATPAGEPETHSPPPAPITPQHNSSFTSGQKTDAPNPATIPQGPAPAAPAPGLALPQPDVNIVSQFGGLEGAEGPYNMAFGGLEGADVLDNFDFDSFLHDDGGFEFDASNFNMGGGDGVEAGAEGA